MKQPMAMGITLASLVGRAIGARTLLRGRGAPCDHDDQGGQGGLCEQGQGDEAIAAYTQHPTVVAFRSSLAECCSNQI